MAATIWICYSSYLALPSTVMRIRTATRTPILERANNAGFLIDGLPNENEFAGGPAAQLNEDTIAEFQVITTEYKAEFGHSSGGVVSVITKSGGNDLHGLASVYHRNSVFDSSDIPGDSNVPSLRSGL